MGTCSNCGTTIVFGGVRDGDLRYCRESCRRQHAPFVEMTRMIPDDVVQRHVREIHEGLCPKCEGPGPVDLFTSHQIWSALVLTSWRDVPEVCCGSCGFRSKARAIFLSGTLGWWGLPWGLIVTPVQLFRNVRGHFASPDPLRPSEALENFVRHLLAIQALQNQEEPVQEAEAVDE